jgi:hypothetical protein
MLGSLFFKLFYIFFIEEAVSKAILKADQQIACHF